MSVHLDIVLPRSFPAQRRLVLRHHEVSALPSLEETSRRHVHLREPAASGERSGSAEEREEEQHLDGKRAHDGVEGDVLAVEGVDAHVAQAAEPDGHGGYAAPEEHQRGPRVGVHARVPVDLLVRRPHPPAYREQHPQHHQVADAAELLVRHAALARRARRAAVRCYRDAGCVGEMGYAEDDLFGPFLRLLRENYVSVGMNERLVMFLF